MEIELDLLKSSNQNLELVNNQLTNLYKGSVGVENLLHENTMLKKSIINFKTKVKEKSSYWQETQSLLKLKNTSLDDPNTQNRYEKRIKDLQDIVNNLSKQIEEKDREIESLQKYKSNWKNLKKQAKLKRKQKLENSTDNQTTEQNTQ